MEQNERVRKKNLQKKFPIGLRTSLVVSVSTEQNNSVIYEKKRMTLYHVPQLRIRTGLHPQSCFHGQHNSGTILQCVVPRQLAPIMEWREGGSVKVITSDVINQTMANDSVSYSFTVPLNVSRKSVRYTCTTRFIESMRPPSTDATNVPNLTLVWTSPLVNFCKIIILF